MPTPSLEVERSVSLSNKNLFETIGNENESDSLRFEGSSIVSFTSENSGHFSEEPDDDSQRLGTDSLHDSSSIETEEEVALSLSNESYKEGCLEHSEDMVDVLEISSGQEDELMDLDEEGRELKDAPILRHVSTERQQARMAVLDKLETFSLDLLRQIVGLANRDPGSENAKDMEDKESSPSQEKSILSKGPITAFLRNRNSLDPYKRKKIMFPNNSRAGRTGAQQLAMLLRIIEISQNAIRRNVVVTKRDVFYRDVNLFMKQLPIDRMIDDLAATLEVSRGDLHFAASPKGLFQGHLEFINTNKTLVSGLGPAVLIPPSDTISELHPGDDIRFILVIEKEAVFNSLVNVNFTNDYRFGKSIIITGKGYPDLSTSQLVSRLSDSLNSNSKKVPIYILVDCDPHGIEILSVYKYGSRQMAYHQGLCAPNAEWLGLKYSELEEYSIDRNLLARIGRHDRYKAKSLLARENLPASWKTELDLILNTGNKAEIQILCSTEVSDTEICRRQPSDQFQQDDGLITYLLKKIKSM